MQTRRRHLRQLLAVGGATSLGGCATILHPERRGNNNGNIDVVPLIFDILWFIPGLVPGIVALAVDFSTGAIYTGRGGKASRKRASRLAIRRGETMTLRAPDSAVDLHANLRLVGPNGETLDHSSGRWTTARRDDLRVALGPARGAPVDGHLELSLDVGGHESVARRPLRLGWS